MLRRHIQHLVERSLADFPVVLITGARQVGKSTLAQALITPAWNATYLTLDDRTTLDAVLADPEAFLAANPTPLVIDEVQRAPDLLRAIKRRVDRKRENGQFLLTGSANLMTLRTVSESLAGRVALHELFPFSWAERNERGVPSFPGDLFDAKDAQFMVKKYRGNQSPDLDLTETILRGGYPPASLMRSAASQRRWFNSYRQTYLERDLRDLANIQYVPDFGRLLVLAAVRTGQTLNVAAFSRELGLPQMTVKRYLDLLVQTYQVALVPAYHTNIGLRLVKTPKLYVADTGLACHLSGVRDWAALAQQGRVGAMVETWVANELAKWIACQEDDYRLYFWRTHLGQEVDFFLARGEEIVALEVKTSTWVEQGDLVGIEVCERAFGRRLRFSVVLYRGNQVIGLAPRRLAVPFEKAFLGPAIAR
ncbi:MAG TPA: ATP-binding protein [Candidatus Methylomirabilis sp.]|nr:ATP-binding protein [Candidatus Methylomirabilis sp.]